MKTRILFLLMFLWAMPSWAAQYYLSPTGSDINSGTSSSSPWLTPNHALNCGDIITAASGTYSNSNFSSGKWGTVTCSAKNNVAWLQCAAFDACKISSSSADAMWISNSFWGVSGWETTVTAGTNGACFHIGPSGSGIVHHVIMANDIANVCKGGGFNAYSLSTTSSVDYIVYVGDIAYNTSGGTGACYSGFNVYQPIASDTTAGTHMYMAGNFSWANLDGTCTDVTDGEGFNYDTFDFDQGKGTSYKQQAVMYNNIAFFNGSSGFLQENNCNNSSPSSCPLNTSAAPTYIEYNTSYGNLTSTNEGFCGGKGEIYIQNVGTDTVMHNLAQTATANGSGTCSSQAIWAMSVANSSGSTVQTNWFAGPNITTTSNNNGFSYGSNTTGTSAAFNNPVNPGAPSCGSFASVPACMATVIFDYTPTAGGASAFGRQPVTNTSVVDPLFPTWLCNGTTLIAGMPSNLITPGCGSSGTPTLTSIAISGSQTVATGLTVQLQATGTYSNSTTQNLTSASTWTSNATSICTVSAGLVTGVANGTCTITAADAGVNSPGYAIKVGAPTLSSIAISGSQTMVAGGPNVQLSAKGTFSDSSTQDVTFTSTWTSSNTAVCTIAINEALVTPVAAGTCNITATNAGVTSSPTFTITVNSATLTGITVASSNGSPTVTLAGTQLLIATGLYNNGSTQNVDASATWVSAQPTICTVSAGLVTGVAVGTCHITATYSGHSNSPSLPVVVVVAGPGTTFAKGIKMAGALME